MFVSKLVQIEAERYFVRTGRVPRYFNAPDLVIQAITDECFDRAGAAGVPFSVLRACEEIFVYGCELRELPTGDHRFFCTEEPIHV